jgi:hypothetical protein
MRRLAPIVKALSLKRAPTLTASSIVSELLEGPVPELILSSDVYDWPQKGETPALAVDAVLACRERHAPVRAVAFPDREADQPQAGKHAVVERHRRVV